MDHGTDPVPDEPQQVHPLDDEPTRPVQREPEPVVARGRGLGANRHLGSVLLSCLAVLGAYAALDYAFYRALGEDLTIYQGGELANEVLIAAAVVAGCAFIAAIAARISGLGPLLAGLVLGVGPCVWIVLDHQSYIERANDLPELWDRASFGLVGASVAVYPLVAGLLIGAGLAGRWRRAKLVTTD